ncbi:zinc finger, CCHC-type containing protein [Tanacetum coccineum]
MTTNQTTNNSIRLILKKEKLNGSNFLDWYRNLRIVLMHEQKLHHLEEALPEAHPATATVVVRNAYTHRVAEKQEVACLMLVSMTPEIQNNLEDCIAFDILPELKIMFQHQAEQQLFETVKAFHAYKQEEGQSVSTYVLKMKGYLEKIKRLGYPKPLVLDHTELHAMMKLVEKDMPKKASVVLAIRQDHIHKPKPEARGKGKNKGKSKLAYDPSHKIPSPAKKEHHDKDAECHYCHKLGHWRRKCPLYLVELKKNKASTSDISDYGAILVSKDDLFYSNDVPHDGIFEIDYA